MTAQPCMPGFLQDIQTRLLRRLDDREEQTSLGEIAEDFNAYSGVSPISEQDVQKALGNLLELGYLEMHVDLEGILNITWVRYEFDMGKYHEKFYRQGSF